MKKRLIVSAAVLMVVTACGGGGGSTTPAPAQPATNFNVDAAIGNMMSTTLSFPALSAKDSAGNTYVMSLSYTPTSDYTFNKAVFKQTIQNLVIWQNGAVITGENLGAQYLYTNNPTKLAALVVAQRGPGGMSPVTYIPTVYTGVAALPTAATIGSSGNYVSGVTYSFQLDRTSTANSSIAGNMALGWSLEADTGTTAFACLVNSSDKICFKINPAGNIQGAKIVKAIGGQLLTFQ